MYPSTVASRSFRPFFGGAGPPRLPSPEGPYRPPSSQVEREPARGRVRLQLHTPGGHTLRSFGCVNLREAVRPSMGDRIVTLYLAVSSRNRPATEKVRTVCMRLFGGRESERVPGPLPLTQHFALERHWFPFPMVGGDTKHCASDPSMRGNRRIYDRSSRLGTLRTIVASPCDHGSPLVPRGHAARVDPRREG
jgi:hypothetical protein